MDLLETMKVRRSARAFLDSPLPQELVAQVLEDASNAPSAINMQPWEVHVVMDEELKRLSRRMMKSYRERQITCAPSTGQKPLPDIFLQRGRDCAIDMTPMVEEMGSDFKTYINEGSLNFYGAPVAALVFLDESFPEERAIDVGSLVGYLVLSAAGHGLASCPIGLVTAYQDVICDQINVPETKRLVISVALGKPDPDAAINKFRSPRAAPKEYIRWVR